MELQLLPDILSVCALPMDATPARCLFWARTDEEISCVCREEDAPTDALAVEPGWRAMRITGSLDFSLVGVLAPIAQCLAQARVGIFAVSTYRTDYILVKQAQLAQALAALSADGYAIDEKSESA